MINLSMSASRFSLIEFNKLPPLAIHADNIRRTLEFYHSYPCSDPNYAWLRFSTQVKVTHAVGVLLDALIIPYYINMYYQTKSQMEYEFPPDDDEFNEIGFYDEMKYAVLFNSSR